MSKPTGKLAMAYATIAKMEARIKELESAQPADQQDEPHACTSCDGSGEYIDALGDWRGYCSCPPGIELEARHAQPATAKVDERAEFERLFPDLDHTLCSHEDWQDQYACPKAGDMWNGWQARAKLNGGA